LIKAITHLDYQELRQARLHLKLIVMGTHIWQWHNFVIYLITSELMVRGKVSPVIHLAVTMEKLQFKLTDKLMFG